MLENEGVKAYIARMQEEEDSKSIASLREIQEFRTRIVRGEEKDQFGLDVSLSDRRVSHRP